MRLRRIKIDSKGALEGLPLYLIILVVIAGIGTAIIAGWMTSAKTTELNTIEIDEEDKILSTNAGQNGDPLEGAVVTLEGCNVHEAGQTNDKGECTIRNINPDLPKNQNFGSIDVTVKYTGDVTITKTAVLTVKA